MTDERYWRVPEVAGRLRVAPETVRRWLRAGKLRGMLLSQQGGYRVPDSEIRRFIAERTESEPIGGRRVTIRDDIHHLVDELDEDAAREALAYLHTLGLPAFLRNAPRDDEPETDVERAAVQEARDELERGEVVSAEEARRRLLE